MKLSRKFLSHYLSLDDNITTKDLAEQLTNVGNEYDSVEKLSGATNIVVGEVLECVMHLSSEHLHICKVKTGENDIRQIICGAPNVRAGIKVAVSLPGATLPNGTVIKETMLLGRRSSGMICSLSELGIDTKFQTEEDKEGIHILGDDAQVGEDAIKYLGYDDEIIDLDLTANRSDLLSMLGLAYEVGAITSQNVTLPDMSITNEIEDINDYISIDVQTDDCPLYLGRMVKNVTIKESPKWMQSELMACGIRPINNVVDISNYVMLETGQPMHFYDASTLGNKVIVRHATKDEKVTTLDGKEHTLSEEDLVIANNNHAVGLAGVMGGLNEEITMSTKDIFIESAIFTPVCIRRTSRRIMKSEASMRFEKGLDPNRTYLAIKRACHLLEKYADATVVKNMVSIDKTDKSPKTITISLDKINKVLGIVIEKDQVLSIFKRLGFEVTEDNNVFQVIVPTRRLDISIQEDLIEEVGRINGINEVVGKLPTVVMKTGKLEVQERKEKEIKRRLQGLGLSEVRTYTLTHPSKVNLFTRQEIDPITLQNPMSDDRTTLRYSLIPSLLEVAEYNISHKSKDLAIYEISSAYTYNGNEAKIDNFIAGLITGTVENNLWQHKTIKADFYYVKGIVENLLNYLGFTSRYRIDTEELPKEYHPFQSARILLDNKLLGYIGMVHPSATSLKDQIYVFELDMNRILETKVRGIKDKEISKYPVVTKDMAFIIDKDTKAGDILDTIKKKGGRLLKNVIIFDSYEGDNIEKNKRSIAFNLTFQDSNRTLTDEEVMTLFKKIIEEVESKYKAILRDK